MLEDRKNTGKLSLQESGTAVQICVGISIGVHQLSIAIEAALVCSVVCAGATLSKVCSPYPKVHLTNLTLLAKNWSRNIIAEHTFVRKRSKL